MDGGGRYLQPMTAYPAGFAVARPASGHRGAGAPFRKPSRISKFFGSSRSVRRRSAGLPLERRLPRFLGTGLALGFFGAVVGFGLWQGGTSTVSSVNTASRIMPWRGPSASASIR